MRTDLLRKVELVVLLHASEDQEAIAQSRCLGLTGMDKYKYIYVYTYIYIQMWSDNAMHLLALLYSSAIKHRTSGDISISID